MAWSLVYPTDADVELRISHERLHGTREIRRTLAWSLGYPTDAGGGSLVGPLDGRTDPIWTILQRSGNNDGEGLVVTEEEKVKNDED